VRLRADRLTVERPGASSFTAALKSLHPSTVVDASATVQPLTEDQLALTGCVQADGVHLEARVAASADGTITTCDNGIAVQDTTEAVLILVAATNHTNFRDLSADPATQCETAMQNARAKSYADLKAAHIRDYHALFGRVALGLGTSNAAHHRHPLSSLSPQWRVRQRSCLPACLAFALTTTQPSTWGLNALAMGMICFIRLQGAHLAEDLATTNRTK